MIGERLQEFPLSLGPLPVATCGRNLEPKVSSSMVSVVGLQRPLKQHMTCESSASVDASPIPSFSRLGRVRKRAGGRRARSRRGRTAGTPPSARRSQPGSRPATAADRRWAVAAPRRRGCAARRLEARDPAPQRALRHPGLLGAFAGRLPVEHDRTQDLVDLLLGSDRSPAPPCRPRGPGRRWPSSSPPRGCTFAARGAWERILRALTRGTRARTCPLRARRCGRGSPGRCSRSGVARRTG